ncbi:MAG: NAD-dependent malic enzyme [Pseudomonadota bacterium]|nr:NAD-dependent malic enzyme [Pseudomonadota bacterium]
MGADRGHHSADAPFIESGLGGYDLLNDPMLNKGTAFTDEEREAFELHGLLPPRVATLDEQVARRLQALRQLSDDFERYVFLRGLQDTNEVLFYALLVRNLEEMMPIVYTPTVGLGCQRFSQIFRKPRGLFLSLPHQDRIRRILANPHLDHVEAIVVTDGERILGLGDQGAGGMGIPIGKLSLYTGCGGLHPATTLPVVLDVGTDNPERLTDPLYIGWKHERVRGEAYDDFVEAFVSAVVEHWPYVLLQWEDFARNNATRLLERYRDRLCTFNDDIQGTAAVAAGTLLAAVNVTGVPLRDQRVAVLGAGSAGCGISALLLRAMIEDGLAESEARSRFFLVDRDGLLVEGMPGILPFQEPFVQPRSRVADWDLDRTDVIALPDVARNARPTVLIGVSGQPGAFPENVVRMMAEAVERPVVFPLSNPTSRAEATPADVLAWTGGRAVIGTGSPFPPVLKNGSYVRIDQTNNSYVFPGVGLGAIAVRARRISDGMLMAAARSLADASPARLDPNANLLPPVSQLRDVSFRVARAVALQARDEGLADAVSPEDIEAKIRAKMWDPVYRPYRRSRRQGS